MLLYNLLNKPWEWRTVLAEYRRRREAQWELVDFWAGIRLNTCRACLREKQPGQLKHDEVCEQCWDLLAKSEVSRSPREHIRVNRLLEVVHARAN